MNTEVLRSTDRPLIPARELEGVLTRRVIAFCIDFILLAGMTVALLLGVALFGILTLGLGWLLYFVWGPLLALMVLGYVWMTLGGRHQATLGMQMMGIKLVRLDGMPIDGMSAVLHSVLFWAGNVVLTPLVLLAALFTNYRQIVHRLPLGTAVIRNQP